MRITDRSPGGRRLQTIFIPAEPKPVMPSEVSDEIVLIHPAVPPMVALKEGKFFHAAVTGAAGVATVDGPQVPTDRYWWVQTCDVRHDDGTARLISLEMVDTVPNIVVIFSEQTTRASNAPAPMARAFLLPNDTFLRGRLNAITAGNFVSIRFFYLEFLHAEMSPQA